MELAGYSIIISFVAASVIDREQDKGKSVICKNQDFMEK